MEELDTPVRGNEHFGRWLQLAKDIFFLTELCSFVNGNDILRIGCTPILFTTLVSS